MSTKEVERKPRKMSQPRQYFMQNLFTRKKTKKILSLFSTKGKKSVNPFRYLNQYCHVKMA